MIALLCCELDRREKVNANERFEYMAELFYEDTGMMAPGKDSPAAFGVVNTKDRDDKWREWLESFYHRLFDLCKSNMPLRIAALEDELLHQSIYLDKIENDLKEAKAVLFEASEQLYDLPELEEKIQGILD